MVNGGTLLFFLIVSFSALVAHGTQYVEDFTTSTYRDSASTAVWNNELGIVHPTLYIAYQVIGGTTISQDISVGDGSHGAFDSNDPLSYASFATMSSSVITINSPNPDYNILRFTSFKLNHGHTLTRSDGLPLIIYSLSTVIIDGVINCDGEPGANASGTVGGNGGLGHCGGKNGGAGGSSTMSGTPGDSSISIPGSGGGGGIYGGGAAGSGGGGGGGFAGVTATPGANKPSNNGGNGGSTIADYDFLNKSGSAGGGGGGGSSTSAGSGGGAGGGVVIIHSVGNIDINSNIIENSGPTITAKGGNGGNSTTGGSGGGGGGGSISIFTFAAVNITVGVASPYVIDPQEGVSGTTTTGGAGGSGAIGRVWDMGNQFNVFDNSSGVNSSENNITILADLGDGSLGPTGIFYSTSPETIISKSYDTASDFTTYNSITTSLNVARPADITKLQLAGSNDNFLADDTGFQNISNLNLLINKRYFKFKIELTNSVPTNPTKIQSVTIDYNLNTPAPTPAPTPTPTPTPSPTATNTYIKENFQFDSGGGCGLITDKPSSQQSQLIIILLFLGIPVLLNLNFRSKN